ncbi:trypsin-like peptidase domain-containing protein [Waterburya agarophytonicola K14]|uniref:Trypsin-like peptidase domain-containing protein n=1 Tax=Waterburya agarophytonicola KI4 TaxID=2874699 RepID=A0A964FG46_9CYAN|nr:HhoA/HhoB/HtrA family serine endopeptidase [Waterburya agarophytonicola]MCC0178570.1 trypsin-like peptidase domain-containing protein [Waterburya agarophytonicola KI4]
MKKSTPLKKVTTSLSLLILGGGIALGGNHLINTPQSFAKESFKETKVAQVDNPENEIAVPQNYVSQVVEKVGNSVVRIDASRTVSNGNSQILNDPFFRQFFGSQIPNIPQERVQRGFGSGFVVSSDGLILTNAHVVDGSDEVNVTLKDGRTYEGKVMGTDSLTDVAVIKIEAEDLPAVTFADSEKLQPGEWAIAIGNPLGLDNTVTTGIVSATGRSSAQIGVADKRVSFIQTDAAINPGNSGGPLLNAQGKVIGINTAIIQNAQGLGFAIPVNTARDIAEELIAKGKVDHPYLGIQMAGITPELRQEIKSQKDIEIGTDQGVIIAGVVPNSPADKAGLRSGDVILEVAEKSVTKADEVQNAVSKVDVDSEVVLKVRRNGKAQDITVKVGVLPQPQQPIR